MVYIATILKGNKMKYIVHATVTMSIEVDSREIKKEFGKVNNRLILEEAMGKMSLDNAFDSKLVIIDTYNDTVSKLIKKGVGSY